MIMRGWAARYSNNIEADFKRGYSFAGWAIQPVASEKELRLALETEYGWGRENAQNVEIAFCEELNGYLPIHDGLCAFWAEEREDAIDQARKDPRFAGLPLWTFEAEYLGHDPEDGTAIVRPLSNPIPNCPQAR